MRWPCHVRTGRRTVAGARGSQIRHRCRKHTFAGSAEQNSARTATPPIPIVLDREPKIDACVYTQCEPWTPARVADLRAWFAELRVDSESPVIVVATDHSAEVAALPEVEELLVVAA